MQTRSRPVQFRCSHDFSEPNPRTFVVNPPPEYRDRHGLQLLETLPFESKSDDMYVAILSEVSSKPSVSVM